MSEKHTPTAVEDRLLALETLVVFLLNNQQNSGLFQSLPIPLSSRDQVDAKVQAILLERLVEADVEWADSSGTLMQLGWLVSQALDYLDEPPKDLPEQSSNDLRQPSKQ